MANLVTSVTVAISSQVASKRLDEFDYEVATSTVYTESTGFRRTVTNGTTDEAVNLGGLTTVRVLAIQTTKVITIKVNGGTEAHTIYATSAIPGVYLTTGAITALTWSNASGEDADVDVLMFGES